MAFFPPAGGFNPSAGFNPGGFPQASSPTFPPAPPSSPVFQAPTDLGNPLAGLGGLPNFPSSPSASGNSLGGGAIPFGAPGGGNPTLGLPFPSSQPGGLPGLGGAGLPGGLPFPAPQQASPFGAPGGSPFGAPPGAGQSFNMYG